MAIYFFFQLENRDVTAKSKKTLILVRKFHLFEFRYGVYESIYKLIWKVEVKVSDVKK